MFNVYISEKQQIINIGLSRLVPEKGLFTSYYRRFTAFDAQWFNSFL